MTGAELKAKRIEAGLTQAALAAMLGVRGSTVTNWEQGLHAVPEWVPAKIEELEAQK